MLGLLNFFELKCHTEDNTAIEYYYFSCGRTPRNPKTALSNGYADDKMRLVCDDRNVTPFEIRLVNPVEYVMKKYINDWSCGFSGGYRVDWEKDFSKKCLTTM